MKVLAIIDMQKDFIDGALGSPMAQAIVPKVVEKAAHFDGKVLFTRDTHGPNYLNTQEGRNLPVKHCIRGTDGWQIADGLMVSGAVCIDKPTFGWTHWNERHFDEIELVGLCTDICVVSNALILKAQFPEVPITVDAACCAGVTPESHQAALTTMKMCQIDVIADA